MKPDRGRRRPLTWLVLPAAWLMAVACHHARADAPRRGPSLTAEILLPDGPGRTPTRFTVRGQHLALLVPSAEDGGSVGVFTTTLSKQDPLFAALAGLPAAVADPPPRPGMPTVQFTVRGDAGKNSERRLLSARPVTDAKVGVVMRELERCEGLARNHPAMTLSVALRPASSKDKVASGELGRTFVATLIGQGEPGSEAKLSPGALVLQAAPDPGPPQPGVTPLPLEWDPISTPDSRTPLETLKPGTTLTVRLLVTTTEPGPRHVRASFDGTVDLRVAGSVEPVRMSCTSTALSLQGKASGSKKR